MPESDLPHSSKNNEKPSILKGWAAIIASVAALVTAIGAFLKPPQEPAAKAAYETLSSAVKSNSEEIAKNHDDILALRNYMEGFAKGVRVSPATSSSITIYPSPDGSTIHISAKTNPSTKPSATPSTSTIASEFPAPRMPPLSPPSIGPRPLVWSPPDFNKMRKQ